MADITLHRDFGYQKTVVPNYFIDAYMVHANGEYVKIYLYLLRCMNDPAMSFSISDFADKFDHTEKDIIRALKYWEKMHLLRLEFDANKELCGICFLDVPVGEAPIPAVSVAVTPAASLAAAAPADSVSAEPKTVPAPKTYNAAQLRRMREETDIQELLFVAEHYIGHTLNSTEMNTILYWKEELHFSNELIDYLIESCVAEKHKSIHYMEKVALEWAKNEILTVDAAKSRSCQHSKMYRAIKKSFGIRDRELVPYEMDFISTWKKDYNFSPEIIAAACEKTIHAIHQVSFEYADSILKNWKKNNVTTLQDIAALDSLHQENRAKNTKRTSSESRTGNRFTDYPQRTYNVNQLEKELLSYGVNQ